MFLLRRFPAQSAASALGIGLLAARSLYYRQDAFLFYIWNLILAWLPLYFAVHAVESARRERAMMAVGTGLLWLLFLPNAPYLVTDLAHWKAREPVPMWLDLILCLQFAWVGLSLGFTSLQIMEAEVRDRYGSARGRYFAIACLGLTSFGVYLGRFRRWNSWDILSSPEQLLGDISRHFLNPLDHRHAWAFTFLCGLFLLSAYWAQPVMLQPAPSLAVAGPAPRDRTHL